MFFFVAANEINLCIRIRLINSCVQWIINVCVRRMIIYNKFLLNDWLTNEKSSDLDKENIENKLFSVIFEFDWIFIVREFFSARKIILSNQISSVTSRWPREMMREFQNGISNLLSLLACLFSCVFSLSLTNDNLNTNESLSSSYISIFINEFLVRLAISFPESFVRISPEVDTSICQIVIVVVWY